MDVLICHVSGCAFTYQLGLLRHLTDVGYRPKLALGSSGGNAVNYIGAAAGWKSSGIERVAKTLSQDLFVSPWLSPPLLGATRGFFEGSLYNQGKGLSDLLSRYFTPSLVMEQEIWTGTYNRKRQKARLFCNRSRESSIINPSNINTDLLPCLPAVYMDGNLDYIGKVSIASASIPALVPPQIIDGEPYVDGGVHCASPLLLMQDALLALGKLHITYINSVDLGNSDGTVLSSNRLNILETGRTAASELVCGQILADRLSAFELLRCSGEPLHSLNFSCSLHNMRAVRKLQRACSQSLLEMYPHSCGTGVDITSFSGVDVIAAMKESYTKGRCNLWWSGDPDLPKRFDLSSD